MSSFTSATDPARFVLEPDTELQCPICMSVLDTPVETPCRHVFCATCIKRVLALDKRCAVCRTTCYTDDLREIVPIVQNMINKLMVRCDYHFSGCREEIPLEFLKSHILKCGYGMAQCRHNLCVKKFPRRYLRAHERCCPNRPRPEQEQIDTLHNDGKSMKSKLGNLIRTMERCRMVAQNSQTVLERIMSKEVDVRSGNDASSTVQTTNAASDTEQITGQFADFASLLQQSEDSTWSSEDQSGNIALIQQAQSWNDAPSTVQATNTASASEQTNSSVPVQNSRPRSMPDIFHTPHTCQ